MEQLPELEATKVSEREKLISWHIKDVGNTDASIVF